MTTDSKRIGRRLLEALRHPRSRRVHSVAAIMALGLGFGMLAASLTPRQADDAAHKGVTAPSTATQPLSAHRPKQANFEQESVSHEARHVADWVVDSGDNRRMSFAIVDKKDAKVFVFDADGRLRGATSALLGLARGDDSVPGIGDRKLSSIRPEERTTPAGRFVASLGHNLRGQEILWVDYDAAISMHILRPTNPQERRTQRLAALSPLDKRITYGCINVPAKFYDNVVHPAFAGTNGIVYVLPETRSAHEVFGS